LIARNLRLSLKFKEAREMEKVVKKVTFVAMSRLCVIVAGAQN